MKQIHFTVDADLCIQCDACVRDCPTHIIQSGKGSPSKVPFIDAAMQELCLECQHCLAVCPTAAISILGFKPGNSIPLSSNSFPSYEQMKTFARGRRSVRQFRKENVPRETIDKLLADIAHAPTGVNDRDLTFTLVDDRKILDRIREQLVTMVEKEKNVEVPEILLDAAEDYRATGKDNFFRNAPHVLVVSPGSKAHCGPEDAVLTLAYFELLAQSAGVGTTWCGMLKIVADIVPGIRSLFGIEEGKYFYAMMFGLPDVKYARTVQRDDAAQIKRVE